MRYILLSTLWVTSLFGGIETYFKDAPNKGTHHKMKNIDFIYMLNLDQRPEKFLACTERLHPYEIYPYRFSAVCGWDLTLDDLNNLGVKYQKGMNDNLWGTCYLPNGDGTPHHEILHVVGRNYFSHCMSQGAIGIVLSHLSILQDALKSGYKTIWVMEDDVEVIQNPHRLSTLIDKLDTLVGKNEWDILFTDQDTKDNSGNYVPCYGYAQKPNFVPKNAKRFLTKTQINSDFTKVGARYGAYSMIVRKSGMKKILNFIKAHKIFLPYDMEFYLPNDIKIYAVNSDVVSTVPNSPSDNGAPRYKESLINN